jgi:hypothetical protein
VTGSNTTTTGTTRKPVSLTLAEHLPCKENYAGSIPVTGSNFHPTNHRYVEHHTYTGPDCAICGQPEEFHVGAVLSPKSHLVVPYPPSPSADAAPAAARP